VENDDEEIVLVKKDYLPPGIVILIKDNGVTYKMAGPEPEEYDGWAG